MNEIYWLTRFDGIITTSAIICIASALLIIFFTACFFSDDNDDEDIKMYKTIMKIFVPSLIISILSLIFVPSTKEAFMIYGIGGTLDYIKSNDKANQLPDKCVEALDKFVDSYITKDNKND